MKTKQSLVYGLIAVLFALSLTGCPNPDPNPTHTHEWGAWQSNAAEHWKECTANDGAEYGRANHDGDPCTVCGYTGNAHTHTYATAWKSNATQHWHECSCGDKTDVADHDWQWVETTAPTLTADGLETETCTTCGATSGNTRPIAKLEQPHEQTPVTINNLFVDGVSVTIKGIFTDTEWSSIWNQVVNAFNNAYNTSDFFNQLVIEGAFNGATITIEKTSTYTLYKTIASDTTAIFININGLSGLTSEKLLEAAEAMGTACIDGVTPPPCTTCLTTYGTTAHLGIDANGNVVACTCGGTNCSNCTEQFAYLDDNNTIKIRKENGITVQQMNDAVDLIKSTYNEELSPVEKPQIEEAITNIVIVSGTTVTLEGKSMKVGYNAPKDSITNCFFDDVIYAQ